jgi:hypothetical protein
MPRQSVDLAAETPETRREGRLEAGALTIGLGAMVLSVCVTMAQAMLGPPPDASSDRRAVVMVGPVCPDGWAARHAMRLGLTEAQVAAWALREALTLSDAEAAAVLVAADPYPLAVAGRSTPVQIALCVLEHRRLTVPPAARLLPKRPYG